MNGRIEKLWHPYAVGLIRAAILARDITGCRVTMRELALEAVSYQCKADRTVFRYQRTFWGTAGGGKSYSAVQQMAREVLR